MPQLTPTTIPPGEQWEVKTFLDQVLAELVANAAPEFQAAGLAIWSGMATVMIVWTGLKMAFSGDYDMWEIVQLVIGLGIPRTMLAYYNTPVPLGGGRSFPELITAQGTWATNVFIGDSWKNLLVTLTEVFKDTFKELTEAILTFNLTDVFSQGISLLIAVLFGGGFMAIMMVFVLLMFCLLMAQVIWAQFALAVATLVGPILIPWLLFPPLSFLFWGWFRTMLVYTFYGVIAGAVLNVFMNVGLAFLTRLKDATLSFHDLTDVFSWYIILWPLIISGILASLKVGELAQLLVSGAGSASAGLASRVRQGAMAVKSGGASLAAGAK